MGRWYRREMALERDHSLRFSFVMRLRPDIAVGASAEIQSPQPSDATEIQSPSHLTDPAEIQSPSHLTDPAEIQSRSRLSERRVRSCR